MVLHLWFCSERGQENTSRPQTHPEREGSVVAHPLPPKWTKRKPEEAGGASSEGPGFPLVRGLLERWQRRRS